MTFPRTSDVILPAFYSLWRAVKDHTHTNYWLHGGRGSTKSSFVSLAIVMLIVAHPCANAVILRKVANTLRDTVYNQMQWAIDTLGMTDYFKPSISPMGYKYLPTGQIIAFKGADEPTKIKGIKFTTGYGAIAWFEELDQFLEDEVRNLSNSIRRGGDTFWMFHTYNPPKTMWSWVNQAVVLRQQRPDTLVHKSTYLDVAATHPNWLGQPFIDEAEMTKLTNPRAYEWEYMGEVTGTGGSVFENIIARPITDDEIATFDNIHNGVDFGWWPDPWAFVRSEFQPANRRILIFSERHANKLLPEGTGKIIREALTYQDKPKDDPIYHHQTVWCDDAGTTEIAAYRRVGLNARASNKGNMRHRSYYWLAGLREIVIDPVRCPEAYKELIMCEFKQDRYGEFMDDFNDGNDHFIDALRYAYMQEAIRSR
jgi:PBSX family phage terminase large subunit